MEVRVMSWRFPAMMMAGALLCGAAVGAEPASSFAELAFVKVSHGNGGGIRGTGPLGDLLLVQGSIEAYDHYEGDVALASLGVGARWPVAPSMQVTFGLSGELVGGAFEAPDDNGMDGVAAGYGAGVELRGRIGERLELQGGVKWVYMKGGDLTRATTSFGARYYLTPRLAAGVDAIDDYFGRRLGLVLRFGISAP
jgi:hypothetical protein